MKKHNKTSNQELVCDDIERDFQCTIDKVSNTKEQKKIRNYIQDILDKDIVVKTISELRSKFKIPKDGFKSKRKNIPPKDWFYTFREPFPGGNASNDIASELLGLCKKLKLSNDFLAFFIKYLFYDEIDFSESLPFGLIAVVDEKNKTIEPYGIKCDDNFDDLFPISIRISPFVGRRDIEGYISDLYSKVIEPLIKQYSTDSMLGKTRKKNPKIVRRNKIIHENKDKGYHETMRILKKYNSLKPFLNSIDKGSIGKIKSLEQKRRK